MSVCELDLPLLNKKKNFGGFKCGFSSGSKSYKETIIEFYVFLFRFTMASIQDLEVLALKHPKISRVQEL